LGETVMIEMRDGIKLSTVINNRPLVKTEKRAALMDRSPYGHDAIELLAELGVLFGMVAVRQDQRGSGKSEGNYTLWHNAGDDAYDTMKWISEQEWSNGEVHMIGGSADGIAVFGAVQDQPKWLKKCAIIWATSEGHTFAFPGGAYRQALTEGWTKHFGPQQPMLVKEVKANEGAGPWWDNLNMTGKYDRVVQPTVMWAGWYDIFANGNFLGWNGYQYQSDPSVRGKQKLVVDPLGHCQEAMLDFPKHLVAGRAALPVLLFLDLFGDTHKYDEGVKAVTFYVMGPNYQVDTSAGNYWTTVDHFPSFIPTPYYLHANGRSVSTAGPPTNSQSASIIYDPKDPVPSQGGNNLEIKCGPLDQTSVEEGQRKDVLTFTTEPLKETVALTGPIVAVLFASTNCTDTDFTVKLTDVYPDGKSHLIQDGIVRLRWRDGGATAKLAIPNHIYQLEASLWNSSYVFNKEHRIRVSLSSSNHPRFSANPNNGESLPNADAKPHQIAHNTFYFSAQHPTRIELPIVTLDQLPEFPVHDMLPQNGTDARAAEILMEMALLRARK
jgi:predicted acyl esterase